MGEIGLHRKEVLKNKSIKLLKSSVPKIRMIFVRVYAVGKVVHNLLSQTGKPDGSDSN